MSSGPPAALSDRVAIVTGASAGIGRACCLALAEAGAHVVAVGRDRGRLDALRAEARREGFGATLLPVQADVRNVKAVESACEAALDRFGRIDFLVASAGILRPKGSHTLKMLAQMSASEWDEVLDTNLRGTYLANKAVLPTMILQKKGHIVNVSSTSGRRGYAFDTAYCASKFGVIGLTEALAEEVRPHGVKVDVILPGAIDTDMWDQNGPFQRPEYAIRPESVASTVLTMLTLPDDTCWHAPAFEPFGKSQVAGWPAPERAS